MIEEIEGTPVLGTFINAKVKYIGEPLKGAFAPQVGEVYEVTEVFYDTNILNSSIPALLRVFCDPNDWNWNEDPTWRAGSLYPAKNPDDRKGEFFIVEDDKGVLAEAGLRPLQN